MKQQVSSHKKGFTLVELLVVMAIMAIMMCMAASVLKDSGSGRGIESGLNMLADSVDEARATACGNDTHTRILIINDPKNTDADSKHLRYIVIQKFERDNKKNYDGTDVNLYGKWKDVSSCTLPPGVFFCCEYSESKDTKTGRKGREVIKDLIYTDRYRLPGRQVECYCIEFDEKGRLVGKDSTATNRTAVLKLVLMNGRLGSSSDSRAINGVIPSRVDSSRRPEGLKGVEIAPHGEVSILRTDKQASGE